MNKLIEANIDFFKKAILIDNHLANIQKIIESTNEILEGNCFYEHQTLKFRQELIPKQINLFCTAFCSQNFNRICEIGFNAGHSCLLFLLANPNLQEITIFDINSHTYVQPSLEYLKTTFPSVNFNTVFGDSTITLPTFCQNTNLLGKYDIVHIDGGHTKECVTSDFQYANKLVAINGLIIIDDTFVDFINSLVDEYITSGKYEEITILKTSLYRHRIIKKILD